MTDLPEHITITDRMVRHIDTICHRCGAQAHIGQYNEPSTTITRLAQWIKRHLHEDQT